MTIKKLPSLKSKEIVSALEKLGFQKDRQKGSHLIMYNSFTKREQQCQFIKEKMSRKRF